MPEARIVWTAGETRRLVYWAKAVVRGLEDGRRRRRSFGVRGGLWRDYEGQVSAGTTFSVWFDAGDRERGGQLRSWPQHRACFVCVAAPGAQTELHGGGKYQYGVVRGEFSVVREARGEAAARLLGTVARAHRQNAGVHAPATGPAGTAAR